MREPTFRIGEWRIEPRRNTVARGDETVHLEPKVMDVLAELARRAGEVVTREELLAAVWGDVHVTEDALNRVISRLRKVLGDDPAAPRYVETIRQRGYRLVAPVRRDTGRAVTRRRPPLLAAALAFLALAVAVLVLRTTTPEPEPAGFSRPLPLTSLPGEERSPALADDGRLAFTWNGGGTSFDLYLKPAGSEELRRLTDDGSPRGNTVFSPDGERLAFVRAQGGTREIVVLAPERGGPEARLELARGGRTEIDWSPDGRFLAFTDRALFLYELATGERLPLLPDANAALRRPVFSPDGHTVAFARIPAEGRVEICRVALDGGTVEGGTVDVLAAHHGALQGLDWTPDGDLVYALDRAGGQDLWRLVPGGEPEQLPALGDRIFDLATTSRGELIYARWTFDANVRRLVLGGEPGDEEILPSSRWDGCPELAADGEAIAFVSTRSGTPELWWARLDGSAPRRLTGFGSAPLGCPAFSPDGRTLAVDAEGRIHLVTVADGATRPLTRGSSPSFSPDGFTVYFVGDDEDGANVWRIGIDGGDPVPVTDGGATSVRVDGEGIFFTKRRPGLWRRQADGGAAEQLALPEQVVADLHPDDRANWTLGGGLVYYVASGSPGGRRLVAIDLVTGARTDLGGADRTPYYGGLAVTDDGDALYYVRVDRSESDLMLVALPVRE